MSGINTVIFDIGNVLIDYDYCSFVKSYGFEGEFAQNLTEAIFENEVWVSRDRGGKTDAEYCDALCKRSPHLEKEIRLIYQDILEVAKVRTYAKDLLARLQANGHLVYLLSNYSEPSFSHDVKQFDFVKHTDGAVISYQVHAVKPEVEIYQALLQQYQIDPEKAVFVDDLQANLDTFQRLGGHTILMVSYEDLLQKLQSLQLL